MSKTVKGLVYAGAIIGVGYGLMKFTVPTEDELISRLPPHLQHDALERQRESRERHKIFMEQMRQAAYSDKPTWQQPNTSNSDKQQ
ncbi:hypothetical protein BX666DRAFT_1966282 [Dichotomocladium elegans]|nr:hypothetical protein BX666DRAFT_1966282 [Dichotomocladium elegans]